MSEEKMDMDVKEEEEEVEAQEEEIVEGTINFSQLTDAEKDAIILEMQKEEIMGEQAKKDPTVPKIKGKKRRRKKKKSENIAPGFGWVAIKMGIAMTFSMTFIFLGPLLIVMALFRSFNIRGVYDWIDLLWGSVGVALTIIAYFLFRYIIKD